MGYKLEILASRREKLPDKENLSSEEEQESYRLTMADPRIVPWSKPAPEDVAMATLLNCTIAA